MRNKSDVNIKITADGSKASKEVGETTRAIKGMGDVAKKTGKEMDHQTLGVRSQEAIQREIKETTAALKQLKTNSTLSGNELKRSSEAARIKVKKLKEELKKVTIASNKMGVSAGNAGAGFNKLRGAITGIGIAYAAAEFVKVNGQLQSQQNALKSLTGSSEEAAEAIDYVRKTADALGQSAAGLTNEYISLTAATKGTALEGDATREIFEAIVGSMSKLGKTSAETSRALQAVSQMASKGVVSMEEMRQQLGEALPGAMQALSKETGITVKDLNKMIESGQLLSADVLPALAKGLKDTFDVDTTQKIDTLTASVERFKNQLALSFTETGENGLGDAMQQLIDWGSTGVAAATGGINALGKSIGAIAAYADGSIKSLDELGGAFSDNFNAASEFTSKTLESGEASKIAKKEISELAKAIGELSGPSLKLADSYVKQVNAAKKATVQVKAHGEATITAAKANYELIEATGKIVDILNAKVQVEQEQAEVARKQAAVAQIQINISQSRIKQINEEISKLESLNSASDKEAEQIKKVVAGKREQIGKITELLSKQEAEVQKLNALSAAQAEQARQALVATQTIGDQSNRLNEFEQSVNRASYALQIMKETMAAGTEASAKLAEEEIKLTEIMGRIAEAVSEGDTDLTSLNDSVDETKQAIRLLKEQIEAGAEAERAMAEATANLTTKQELLADAIEDTNLKLNDQIALSGAQLQLDMSNLNVRANHIRSLIQSAKARGDEVAQQRLQIQLSKIEVERIKVLIEAKEREFDIAKKKLELTKLQANADGLITAAEKRQIEIMKIKLEIIGSEADGYRESAEEKKKVTQAIKNARKAESEHGDEVDKTTGKIKEQSEEIKNNNSSSSATRSTSNLATARRLGFDDSQLIEISENLSLFGDMIGALSAGKIYAGDIDGQLEDDFKKAYTEMLKRTAKPAPNVQSVSQPANNPPVTEKIQVTLNVGNTSATGLFEQSNSTMQFIDELKRAGAAT